MGFSIADACQDYKPERLEKAAWDSKISISVNVLVYWKIGESNEERVWMRWGTTTCLEVEGGGEFHFLYNFN